MTLYAGEEVKVTTSITDFDGTVLTASNVTSVTIAVNDSTGSTVATAAMTYDSVNHDWFYMWDTTGRTAGTYKAKVTVVGTDGKPSWEWKRIRLARDLT